MRSIGERTERRERVVLRRALAATACLGLLAFAVRAPAGAATELTTGSAAATATVVGLNIPYSGANIGIDVGLANASYFEQTAKASAVTLEPAFLRIPNTLKVCGGFAIEIPPATSADTNAAGGPATNRKQVSDSSGVEEARAEPGSHGHATVTGASFGFPGIVEVRGGEAESDARLDVATQTRTARGEVRTGSISLLGGLIELRGLRWTVEQQAVGADDRSLEVTDHSEFSIGAITLAGLPLPAGTGAELASSIDALNQVLAPMSLQLRLPVARPNGGRGLELTPLTVALGGRPTFGDQFYDLLAGPSQTSLVNLFNTLTQPTLLDPARCDSLFGLLSVSPEANALLNTLGVYAPVILSAAGAAFGGGAELNLNVGGARTTYDATFFAPRSAPSATTTVAARPPTASSSPGPTITVPGSPPVELAGSPERISTRCETTSPVGRPGCSKGFAPIAATAAALVTGALFAADELGRRRRRRQDATEEVT